MKKCADDINLLLSGIYCSIVLQAMEHGGDEPADDAALMLLATWETFWSSNDNPDVSKPGVWQDALNTFELVGYRSNVEPFMNMMFSRDP